MIIFYIIGAVALIIVLFFFAALVNSFYLVRQAEVIVIERLGKMHRVLHPGLRLVLPFIDNPRSVHWTFIEEYDRKYIPVQRSQYRIDLREAVYDFPKQHVITKDNVTIQINALLYYRIFDPIAAIYEVEDLPKAIEMLTQTTLRNVIGHMDLDETLVSRDSINEKLRLILDDATDKWGVKVSRVELQEIRPPEDIRQAMEKQMRAERDRRAAILEAEGKKRAAILEAEGFQESQILKAQGEAQARKHRADGEATARLKLAQAESEAITLIKTVSPQADALAYLIAMQYIKALPELTQGKDNKLIVIPYEASSLMGSLSGIKKIFNEVEK
jgi:regulator of protease activity HflC (stomatin/prohibitin superfamily)